jgi:hypothetical protein
MKLTGENRSNREKTCPSDIVSTRNPTWTDPGSNPDYLNHCTAPYMYYSTNKNVILDVSHELDRSVCEF